VISKDWLTLAEKTNYRKTPTYQETINYAKRLDQISDLIVYKSFGKSGEGRDLPLLIAAKNGAFSPEVARRQKKAIVLIQACIHAGESDGKDAGLALFRDIAITKTRLELLDNVVVLFIPIFNPDGHEIFSPYNRINQNGPDEMGFRATSTNLNLNRDYMKLDAPETRAFMNLWNYWKPDFFIDSHVTDGADYQYNITYEFPHFQEISEYLRKWMFEHFEKKVVPEIEKQGNLITHYVELKGNEIKDGIVTFIATPRFSTGYVALRNRPSLLIESHSLKSYRSRVRGTYDFFWKTIEEINRSKESLFEAIRKAELETIERGKVYDPKIQFPLRLEITDKSEPFLFKAFEYSLENSPISGSIKIVYSQTPIDLIIPKFDNAKITASVAPPLFYIIPPQWKNIIDVLQTHGVKFYRLAKAISIEVESYRLVEPKWAQRSFEGRLMVSYKAIRTKEIRSFPENSVVIPLAQELGNVIIHLLEPESQDSFVAWGFLNPIFEQKEFYSDYIMEKIALEMLRNNEALREEFEERLRTDKSFRENPRARLDFFYERSPYFDSKVGLYPIGRIIKPLNEKLLK
jgi:hypothetical protein